MTIFRNKANQNLYVISHLIKDIRHTNNNEFAGIYAKPYKWEGSDIVLHSKDHKECMAFVKTHFDDIAEC